MKRGLILGIIAGFAAAYLLGKEKLMGTPEPTNSEAGRDAGGVVDKLKHQAEEAVSAAKQAAEEKEAEMRRRFEESKE